MAYFAAALARGAAGWTGAELELNDVEDLDGVVEEVRRVDEDADLSLLFLEENDEWFAIVRVGDDGDPRVFLSDARVVETSELAAILAEAAEVVAPDDEDDDEEDDEDDDEDEETAVIAGDPLGDADVMSDLGTSAASLLELCAEEGQLPADIISTLCERAGCLDTLESLRIA